MTGRDLIMYILQNNLENEPIVKNGELMIGVISVEKAAEKFGVGVATIGLWFEFGMLDGFKIHDTIYILENSEVKNKERSKS